MTKEDLKNITLKTELFHPYFGKGHPIEINDASVMVRFKSINESIRFFDGGSISECKLLQNIYLFPVKIVKDE